MNTTESMKLVNLANGTRAKIYYQLNQLERFTGLSQRTLKYRMKIIKEKYAETPNLLYRMGRSWKIHHTLISEFLPKYKRKKTLVVSHPWQTLVTWNTRDGYDKNYHIQLISEVKSQLPDNLIAYSIEKDSRGVYHLHAITDGKKEPLETAVENVLLRYINKKDYRTQIEKINNTSTTVGYLVKNGGITII